MTDGYLTSSHWGIGVVHVEGGRVREVVAHPDDPDPSPINGNIAASLNGAARVLRPAVRKGYLAGGPGPAGGARGREDFVEVDWDTALDLVASELTRIRDRYGSGAVYAGSYGWASAGRFHHAQSQLKRFLNAGGGFVASKGNYSYHAALVLMPHIVGDYRRHVKEATRLSTLAEHGRLVVMFGGLPIRNAQVSGGGVGKHRLRGVLEDAADAGVRFVNLSPLRTDAATSLNAEWLPPRPGSDTALMMALAHTLLSEGLHDRAFLDRYTIGFDRLADYLNGADGIVKDAEWAADICGLPADRIRTLARDMAAGPTLITTAVSLQRADWGEQPLWMTVALAAMLGQIGLPGAGYGIGYAADSSIGTMDRAAPWSAFPQGSNPVADFIPVAMISDMLLNPGGRYDFNGAERTFPDIRMVWWAGGNPFHHHQDLGTLAQAFQRPETVIVNEFNWTATARHADIVLPVAAPQERTDFGAGTQDNALVPMPKFAEPPGEARIEFEIFRDLEARLDLADGFSKGRTAEEWIDRLWDDMRRKIPELPDFEAFLNGGPMEFDDPDPEHVFLSRFRQDPEAHRLPTPSGRIELFSETIAGFGYADCPGHPVWRAPRDWSVRDRYPLHLVSGQPGTRLHSQLDNGSYSRSRKVKDREPVLLHPEDAAARGIADGDIVEMFNDRGRCLAGAVVTDDVLKGTVFLWTGAWYDPDENGLCRHGNPNVLTHDLRTSALSQGPAAQSALVEVKVAVDPPPVLAFEPPIFGNLP